MKPFKSNWSVPAKSPFPFPSSKSPLPTAADQKPVRENSSLKEESVPSPSLPSNGYSEDKEDPHRYWKAAISRLPTEKREMAWEWYIEHCQGEKPLDTLPGLLLLLEANAAYLDSIPKEVSRLIQSLPSNNFYVLEEGLKELKAFVSYLENYQKQIEEVIHTLAESHQEIKQIVVEEKSRKDKELPNRDELIKKLLTSVESLEKKKHLLRIWAVWFLLAVGFLGGASLFFILKIIFPKIF
ncbi:hypothetical protein [Methylacidiphilum caldifontis]|uniref:Uncharacterized protein n=1 Tax=Methylacidiphilum caldifontis TaxID=2795386 RepID=A0A4Y8PI12_9BACT|nr:hypothetical protein [Methylacidiphilum caldifontis]TFE73391.1 hypothetical protein A7Q10_00045 [Methylacidiphilum caldifontis]